jgi:hypothetical protein
MPSGEIFSPTGLEPADAGSRSRAACRDGRAGTAHGENEVAYARVGFAPEIDGCCGGLQSIVRPAPCCVRPDPESSAHGDGRARAWEGWRAKRIASGGGERRGVSTSRLVFPNAAKGRAAGLARRRGRHRVISIALAKRWVVLQQSRTVVSDGLEFLGRLALAFVSGLTRPGQKIVGPA